MVSKPCGRPILSSAVTGSGDLGLPRLRLRSVWLAEEVGETRADICIHEAVLAVRLKGLRVLVASIGLEPFCT